MKLLAIIALLLGASQSAWAGGLSSLPGHVPSQRIARSVHIGRKSSTDKMQLAVTLSLKDPAGLADFVKRVYDPADPSFHQFLTPEQFADKFAPSQKDFDDVSQYLTAQGLNVVQSHANRLVIDVTGSVAAVESAFQIEMHNYIAADGRIVHAPTSDPLVSDSVAPQLNGILGLNSFAHWKKHSKRALTPEMTFGQVSGYMTPAKIQSAYGLSSITMTGTGETLALFELDGYTPSDITTYASNFSFTAPTLDNVMVDGATGTPGDGADEVTLDIELAMAVAPGVTKIMVYEGPPTASEAQVIDLYSKIANDNLAKEVSSSWGAAENEVGTNVLNSENSVFLQLASQGQTVFAAAGDSGAYDDSVDDLNSTLEVDDPGSQPYVTSVGGTTLTLTNGTIYKSETSWKTSPASGTFGQSSYNPDEGGGGGISIHWPLPTWQAGLSTAANRGSTTMRMVPDVSLDADPDTGYAIYVGGTWNVFGGTSCAAPIWAGFSALVNQARVANGLTRVGFINPILYQAAQGAFYSADYHDIKDQSTNLFYPAQTGYDLTTGWGSFNGGGLFSSLTMNPPAPPTDLTAVVIQ